MKRNRIGLLSLSLSCVAAMACDSNLAPADNGDLAMRGPAISSTTADGVTTTVVDSTAESGWIYLDLDANAELSSTNPDAAWDVSFQRFKIRVNGGVNGSGNVAVLPLPGANFAALQQAPTEGYITDAGDVATDMAVAGLAFESGDGWYSYDVSTHVLTARETVYVVRTTSSAYFKVQLLSYYDAAGTPGFLKFQWAPLLAPSTGPLVVDAKSTTEWTYVSLLHGVVDVGATDASTASSWDVAFLGASIKTNGGTSGAGAGGARLAGVGATFESITTAPTTGFVIDAELPIPGPPGSGTFSGSAPLNGWYDYDATTHAVTPKSVVFLVRTATGQYGKLQVVAYTDRVYELRVAPLLRQVEADTITVDASAADAWTYVSLRDATVLNDSEGVAVGSQWDVAFSGAMVRTNSGTSGGGSGGAVEATQSDFSLVLIASGEFSVDAMLPIPGPPGSPTTSQNPVLAGWYDYDATTHVATPKDKTYLVRTADGGFAKLKITAYADNHYTLQSSYAGPLRNDF